jgi:glucose-1-phosphate thymidylyltransferase
MEKIGLIPAGIASRLGSMAFSKELLPIGFNEGKQELGLKAVSTDLLEKFHEADVRKAYMVIRKGKWDILDYYGDGSQTGVQLSYLITAHPFGVPFTLDQAYPFVKKTKIFVGFPDILFGPKNAFALADATLGKLGTDLILGVYPVKDIHQIQRCDMVKFDKHGRISQIIIKPEKTDLQFSWIFAIWKPDFTLFMHEYLKSELVKRLKNSNQPEIYLGHVIQAAIENKFSVSGHLFPDFHFLDIGTPGNLAQVLKDNFSNID